MRRARIALLALLFGALAGCATGSDAVDQGGTFSFVAPGGKVEIFYPEAQRQRAPNLSGEAVLRPGKQIRLADYAGKVTVLNIWGSWCGPCRVEAPELQDIADQRDDVQIVGVDVRDPDRSAPQDFMRNRGLTYPSIYDPSGRVLLALQNYPKNIVPSTILLDKQQRVAAVFLKPLTAGDLLPTLDRLARE